MRKFFELLAILVLLFVPLAAQDFPKAEVFGGYQFTRLEDTVNLNGWNAALNGNVDRWFGITADFSGSYESGSHLYTYMFGPTVSYRTERAVPFAHALFGGATSSGETAFSMGLGGGLDVVLADHLALRLAQADWLMFRSHGITSKKNVRYSAGIVFRF
ncbi:MAG: porin family protein [Acidobacteriia bacterium]|nr:porin family protein [Terriglobia bacterium]